MNYNMSKKDKEQLKFKDWSNITLSEFDEIQEIIANNDETTATIKLLALLSGESEDYFWDKPLNDFTQYSKHLQFLNDYKIKDRLPNFKTVKINGKKYRVTDLADMTTGQFFDFQNTIKNSNGKFDIATILSLFLVPDGSKYSDNSYDIAELRDIIYNNFTFDEAQNLMGFSMAKYIKYLLPSKGYLATVVKKMTKEQREEMVMKVDEIIASLQETMDSLVLTS